MRKHRSSNRILEFRRERFETSYIFISDERIRIKKNNNIIKDIEYSEIKNIEIYQGFLINKRGLSILFGSCTFIGALFWIIKSIPETPLPWGNPTLGYRGFWLLLLTPWIFLIIGVYLIIMGFTKSKRLRINYNSGGQDSVEIKKFEKDGRLDSLIEFLDPKVKITQYNTRS